MELRHQRGAVALEHREDGRRRGHDGHRERGREHEAARGVLDEVDDLVAREDDPADAAEDLGEGRHHHRRAALEVEVFEHAAAVGAEGARAVGVVDDQHGLVSVAHLDDGAEGALVAVERVDALDEHQGVLALAVLQHALQRARGVVVEESHLRRPRPGDPRGQEGAVEDAGVREVVEDERGVAVGQRHHRRHHGLVPRGGDQRGFSKPKYFARRSSISTCAVVVACTRARREPAGEVVDRALRGLLHLRVVVSPR
jgi:hypothetical protein